ncbi:MAG: hypothetical protein V4801_02445 [Burkholderia gladioli]
MDETNPAPSPEVVAAVAESNQATSASLSTAVATDSPASAQEALDGSGEFAAGAAAPAIGTSLIGATASPSSASNVTPSGGFETVSSPSLADPTEIPQETLLARLHADLEALEQKIELGIHVFAHEVTAIREQVKNLI